MLETVIALMVAISAIAIHALRNNKQKEKEQEAINEKELWPVSFFLVHEPKLENQYEWFVANEAYFESYDARLLAGIGHKEALKILALTSRTNNLERVSKNHCQVYRINGFIMKNKESKFVARNGNGKLVSVAISQNTAFRILARAKKNIS